MPVCNKLKEVSFTFYVIKRVKEITEQLCLVNQCNMRTTVETGGQQNKSFYFNHKFEVLLQAQSCQDCFCCSHLAYFIKLIITLS